MAQHGIGARLKRADPLPLLFWLFVLVGIPGVAVWMALQQDPQVIAVVPVHDLAPYRIVAARDLKVTEVDGAEAQGAIRATNAVVGHYPLVALARGRSFHADDLGPRPPRRYVEGAAAVALRSSNVISLGGAVHAGDVVMLTQIPSAQAQPPHMYDNVYVLAARGTNLLVVAIPDRRLREFAAADRGAAYRVTRRVTG